MLGHNSGNQTYDSWTDQQTIDDYKTCIPFLTFLDFTAQEKIAKDIKEDSKLKDLQIVELNKQVLELKGNESRMKALEESLSVVKELMKNPAKLKQIQEEE